MRSKVTPTTGGGSESPPGKGARSAVLYLSYDGVLEPLGESQVVAYLERLADTYEIHLISFEKPRDLCSYGRVEKMSDLLVRAGIRWSRLTYHKHPKVVSTLWDMGKAIILSTWLAVKYRARLLHGRSILCAAMLYPAQLATRAKLIVDIRGFWADERVDGGMIPAGGLTYRAVKAMEAFMLRRADHVVTLTQASVPILREDPCMGQTAAPISVITTCADLEIFSPGKSAPRPLTIGYVGQVGTWYMLDEMLAFFSAIVRFQSDARLLIVNKDQQETIRGAVARAGFDPKAVEIVAGSRSDMPAQIRRMDAGLALIRPCFSKIASAPTKLGEYLGCGVPVVGNFGCGDMARIILEDEVGVAMEDTSPQAMEAAAAELLTRLKDPELSARCVSSARLRFALKDGAARYKAIYESLIGPAV